MLTLRQMQQFLAVAEAMSFRRAAERLHMAQPPLTAAIRQMEAALGVRLFARGNRITALTAAGAVLREEAARTLAQAERAEALTRRAGAGESGRLRIGFVASAISALVPALVTRFRATHPGVTLELSEAPSARQVAWLREDRLDVGIVVLPLPEDAAGAIASRVLRHGHLVAAVPAGHALAGSRRGGVTLAALGGAPWILFPRADGPGLHARIAAAWAQAGIGPEVVQRATQMETIIGLVAAGLGVALVPAGYMTLRRRGVVFRAVTGPGTPIAYDVALAWRRGEGSAVVQAFLRSAGG